MGIILKILLDCFDAHDESVTSKQNIRLQHVQIVQERSTIYQPIVWLNHRVEPKVEFLKKFNSLTTM